MAQEPSKEILLSGIHAYAEKSIAAGDTIHFRVSSSVPYEISVVQLGSDMDKTTGDTPVAGLSEKKEDPRQQPIFPGSYMNVDMSMPALPLQAMTLECWVRPWVRNDSKDLAGSGVFWQGVMSKYSYPNQCGFGLFLTENMQVFLYFGDGGHYDEERALRSPDRLDTGKWHHVVGVWDGQNASLWIDGQAVEGPVPLEGPVRPGTAPLRLAAYGQDGLTQNFLNGDLAMPVIYSRALSKEEIEDRYKDNGLTPPKLQGVLACWPLKEERGTLIEDISGNALHGRIINGATWMIGGPSFDGDDPSRFTTEYDPNQDATRGHGLRFSSLDLYDCGWQVSHCFKLPSDLTPGIYVGRISYVDEENQECIYDVTFVVRKARGLIKEPLLVICATNTWLAYSCSPFVKLSVQQSMPLQRWYPNEPVEGVIPTHAPNHNFYKDCPTDQPTYRMGLNLPWPVAAPYSIFSPIWEDGVSYSHLTRAERFTHCWLKAEGYTFDVITDFDLHLDPDILKDYHTVIIPGHSEYWSAQAYQGLERYLAQSNGKVIVLSGNTMFWRVSFDDGMTTMECRKYGASGSRPFAKPGELYHSDDGRLGGLMRRCGYPCWKLLGMESAGAIMQYDEQASYQCYTCENPGHHFFDNTNFKQGTEFAKGAVGHEWDVRVDLEQMKPPSISKEELKEELRGLETLAYSTARKPDCDEIWNYNCSSLNPPPEGARTSQIIYWKRPNGGTVFYAGSIGAGQALHSDNTWATILNNVLRTFEVQKAFKPS